jgi:hypothetical protein
VGLNGVPGLPDVEDACIFDLTKEINLQPVHDAYLQGTASIF